MIIGLHNHVDSKPSEFPESWDPKFIHFEPRGEYFLFRFSPYAARDWEAKWRRSWSQEGVMTLTNYAQYSG